MAARITKGAKHRRRSGVVAIAILGAIYTVGLGLVALYRPDDMAPADAATRIVAEYDTIKLPVPVDKVPVGTKVSEIKFELVAYPRHQVPEGAVLSVNEVFGMTTTAPLPAGLPLYQRNFSDTYWRNPVLERIPVGMRAITIRVDATSAVEGWAGSGSIVDVLLVDDIATLVIAERVKVLSAERSVAPVDGSGLPTVPTTVTLLVTQEQALAINTAVPRGKIAFALRGQEDEQHWRDRTFSAGRLHSSEVDQDPIVVKGYVVVKDQSKRFALTDGHWVATEVAPEGFFVAGRE